jgi:hypothetical protein
MAGLSDLHAEGVTDLHSYSVGFEDANARIIKWIEENRTEVTDGVYRDHFNSQSLIAFIKGENNG